MNREAEPETKVPRPKTNSRRHKIVIIASAAVILLALLVSGAALVVRAELDPGEPVLGVSDVAVRDNDFGPSAIQVPAGTTVTWQWMGEEEHNVVGDAFEAPAQRDGSFAQTFNEPGTHGYECTLHFGMTGEVVVTD